MDRIKREDVEKTIDPVYSHSTSRNSAEVRVDDLLAHQTLLLLEIRDLLAESLLKLANPVATVRLEDLDLPFEPGRIVVEPKRALRRRLRTNWICKQERKATFKCVDCRRLVEVSEDAMRGLPGPWMPLKCRRCGREFELDGRELEGEIGKMMRAFFPFIDKKVQVESAIRHERVFGGRDVFDENPVFCGKPIGTGGILTCKAAPGHPGNCWASR